MANEQTLIAALQHEIRLLKGLLFTLLVGIAAFAIIAAAAPAVSG